MSRKNHQRPKMKNPPPDTIDVPWPKSEPAPEVDWFADGQCSEIMFVECNGRLVLKVISGEPPPEFLKAMREAIDNHNKKLGTN